MGYKEFNTLRKETNLLDTIEIIREIWYGFAEGYYILPESYMEFSSLVNNLSEQFPPGWTFRLHIDGSFLATKHVSKQQVFITVFKEKNGNESIKVSTHK